jgi:hypothetical protein
MGQLLGEALPPFERLGWGKAPVIARTQIRNHQQKPRPWNGVRVSGENMLCQAMPPHPRQFLPLKKDS